MILDVVRFVNNLRRRFPPPTVSAPAVVPPCLPPASSAIPFANLPAAIASDPLVQKYQALLGALPWLTFPERPTDHPWPGPDPQPRAPFVAAFLVKLHEQKRYMSDLRAFLIEHPALTLALGFAPIADPSALFGIDVAQTVPKRRQLSSVLRTLPNASCQFLLSASVELLRETLPLEQRASFGDTIAGDTQAILAWVKENNPKQFVEQRFDKQHQPSGDPDCRFGVKKGRSRMPEPYTMDGPAPTSEATGAKNLHIGVDVLWGYASGVVVGALPAGRACVLAERTRPFHESDASHFFPLMEQVERRLGRRPRFGAWDTAYDAHYVYDYFHSAGGFAAVPFNTGKRGGGRQFDASGSPLCAAGLPMPQVLVYWDRTSTLVPHQREKCGCPLFHPRPTGQACPIGDAHAAKGGCTTTLAVGAGARLRHTLNRESAAYQELYAQRTMVERINAQAEALHILRPKVRRGRAIANQNTLIYVLINLRLLARMPRPPQA